MVLISPRLLRQNPSLFQHKKFALTSERLRKTKVTTANHGFLFDLSIEKTNPTKAVRRYWLNSHQTSGWYFLPPAPKGKLAIQLSNAEVSAKAFSEELSLVNDEISGNAKKAKEIKYLASFVADWGGITEAQAQTAKLHFFTAARIASQEAAGAAATSFPSPRWR